MSFGPEVSLNLNVRGLRVSPTLAIAEQSAKLAAAGRQVFRLGLGQSPFPVPESVVDALRANASRKDYLPVKGLAPLREAVAEYHRRRHGIACATDGVLIAPGSKELMFLLAVVFYGDIVIPTPAWVSYAPQAQIVGRQVCLLPTRAENGYRLTAEELDAFVADDPVRPRLLILNYPSNPTGATYDEAGLAALAEVARRHRMVVLSDEIYGELHYEGRHASIARAYPEGTILSSGLSKWCGAGGWRLGTFAFPPGLRWLLDALAVVASETYTSTSAPIQYAAIRAFQGGTRIERYLEASRRILHALTFAARDRLVSSGASVPVPEGGFYLFPDWTSQADRLAKRRITTSERLATALLEEAGVAVLPGTVFGRPPRELCVRIATVDFDGAKALTALDREAPGPLSSEAIRRLAANVLEAIDRIVGWIG